MANFFELLGLSSDELADSNPELIVQVRRKQQQECVRPFAPLSRSSMLERDEQHVGLTVTKSH